LDDIESIEYIDELVGEGICVNEFTNQINELEKEDEVRCTG